MCKTIINIDRLQCGVPSLFDRVVSEYFTDCIILRSLEESKKTCGIKSPSVEDMGCLCSLYIYSTYQRMLVSVKTKKKIKK